MPRILLITAVSILFLAGAFLILMLRLEAEPDVAAVLPTGILEVNGRSIMVELALTAGSQSRGLSYRDGLDPDRGMLFVYDSPRIQRFWMHEMRFPLDMVFINGDEVVDVAANVPHPQGGLPKIVTSSVRADKVLEINAGKAEEWGVRKGTVVNMAEGVKLETGDEE
jgi:uncharacterized membrane protein (UPF0127 family)